MMNNPPTFPFPHSPQGQHPQQQQNQHPSHHPPQQPPQHQKKQKQRSNNSCYNCGGQGHQAEQCPEQGMSNDRVHIIRTMHYFKPEVVKSTGSKIVCSESQKNQAGGDNSFGLNYGPNPNQNPLDRVGGEIPPTRPKEDSKSEPKQAPQQQRKQ